MIARRNLLIGGGCAVAAGVAYAMKPRTSAPLLQGAKLADLTPAVFDGWKSNDIGDPLAINGEGTLSAKLYNELVGRLYVNEAQNQGVQVLLAYGGQQSDELQLHRPEVCYPAFGYNLIRNEPMLLPLASGVSVPARQLLAESEAGRECVLYWSRLGEALPQDAGQQREARFQTVLDRIIPDGLLARFSTDGTIPEEGWSVLATFAKDLIGAVKPGDRKVLIGTQRAQQLQSIAARV